MEGGVVKATGTDSGDVVAAVHGGFVSVSDNVVSVLAEIAELGEEVDVERAKSALDRAVATIDMDAETAASADRARARLRAAGMLS